ncbi:MAG: GlxA family transcriptional regulator [Ectothiorhodospiraceae bacterium]
MSDPNHNGSPRQVGFLLLPRFSMMSFAATVEPLRMANRLAGETLYEWPLYSLDDEPVPASNGMLFPPTRTFGDAEGLHTLFVVAGYDASTVHSDALNDWLRQLARSSVRLGATSTGTLLLARAGVLDHRRCTIHWENADSLQEEFPLLFVTNELYEMDGNVLTCCGGVAGLDMMLHTIALDHGEALANAVAEQNIHPSIRPAHAAQRMSLQRKHGITHPRLLRAVELMREHLEEIITCAEIAERAGVSARQLERLFRNHFERSPARFYLELRLEKAQHLVHQSTLPVVQIASACGFASSSHLARCYRQVYGVTPSEARNAAPNSA